MIETAFKIADGLDLVVISADEVLIQFGLRSYPSELIRDTDLTGTVGRVVARLQEGPATVEDLLGQVTPERRDAARDLVDALTRRGVLVDVARSPVEQYLSYTFVGDAALADRSMAVVGLGPVGLRVAHSLLQHGLGRLVLLDDRPVDDAWRACTPVLGTNGEYAGAAAFAARDLLDDETRVTALNGGLDATGVEAAIAGCDLIVLALEQPHPRLAHLVNRFCLRDSRPWLMAQLDGNFASAGPLFVPPDTACYNDLTTLTDAASRSPEMARRYRRHLFEREAPSFFPGLPAHADIVAGLSALASVHFLLRGTCFAMGRVLSIDLDRMLIDVEDVLRLPRCPVCGQYRPAPQPPFSAEIVTRAASLADRLTSPR